MNKTPQIVCSVNKINLDHKNANKNDSTNNNNEPLLLAYLIKQYSTTGRAICSL